MVTIKQLRREYGYAALVGVRAQNLAGVRHALQRGLPFSAVLNFQALAGMNNIQIMALLRM